MVKQLWRLELPGGADREERNRIPRVYAGRFPCTVWPGSRAQTLLEKIASEQYDYVVIQQITYFMADVDSAEIVEDTRLLCEAIREAGVSRYSTRWVGDCRK